jgi:hypothetical protein
MSRFTQSIAVVLVLLCDALPFGLLGAFCGLFVHNALVVGTHGTHAPAGWVRAGGAVGAICGVIPALLVILIVRLLSHFSGEQSRTVNERCRDHKYN